jgi:hypothetical protein
MEPIDSDLVDALVERVVEARQKLDLLNQMWQGFDESLREDNTMLGLQEYEVERERQADTASVAELTKLSPDWLRSLAYPSLMDKLSSSNPDQREKAAKGLDTLAWEPADDRERALFYIAKQWWSKVQELGDVAVEPLVQLVERAIDRGYPTPVNPNYSIRGVRLAPVDVVPIVNSAATLLALGQQRGFDWLSDLLASNQPGTGLPGLAVDALLRVGTPAALRLLEASETG